jgi:N-acetylglucosamine kinase-like BadF-type ATPase
MMALYLGVDAGNSKTVVLACLASGKVVGVARSGRGDIYGAAGEAEAVAAVLGAAATALAGAGATRSDVVCAAFRLAGVDWPEDEQFWDETLNSEWPGLTRSVLNDGYAAIRCGEPSGVGVAVNAGTNAAVAARGPDGTTWHMGWWGQHAMGAHGLVSEAFKAAFLACIGAAPETALGPALLDFYGLPDLGELNRWFTRRHDRAPEAERNRAARVVTGAARQGDPVAMEIVNEQGRRLAFYAEIAARHAGLRRAALPNTAAPIPVVMSGSVLTDRDSPVAAALCDHLPRALPGADPRHAVLPPAAGAVLDALAEGGVTLTPAVVERLRVTMPPSSFFIT